MIKSLKKFHTLLTQKRVIKTGDEIPAWVTVFKRIVYLMAFSALALIMVEAGMRWQLPFALKLFSIILDYLVFLAFLADMGITFYYTVPKRNYFRQNILDLLVFVPMIFNMVSLNTGAGLIALRNTTVLIKLFSRSRKFSKFLKDIRLNTAQIIAISFMITILVGTLLLTFPSATEDGKGTSFVDALFTATSATCVTGLIVQDTPTYFSTFGEWIILILIQLGGLGIMTYSAFIALILGRFSLSQRKMVQNLLEEDRNVLNLVYDIFKMTFIIELIGFLLLFIRWIFHFHNFKTAVYFSFFHSISAFCNAGFSLFSDSLMGFTTDPMINITIMGLIIFGGIGFMVVYDILGRIRKRQKHLSPHSKIVLWLSLSCIIIGFITFYFLEFDKSMLKTSLTGKFWIALFQSVSTRTAGFNTIAMNELSRISLTVMIVLMFIGASPGSTGGGIKTSTLAVVLLSIRNVLQGKEEIDIFNRSIPVTTVYKAIAIVITSLLIIFLFFILLMAVENKPFLDLLFETVSAFGTVGLSTGITSELTLPGKLIVTLLMYIGRIGPMTMVLALASKSETQKISYPEARIMIG